MIVITRQQETFLQAIMQGKTQHDAYIVAYPNAKKWKQQAVDVNASKLMKDPNVALRYAELQRDAQEANAITRDAVLTHLKLIAFAPWGTACKVSDQIKAMSLICQITGLDSPRSVADDEDYD